MASGDVGVINPNGSIRIIDRAKNIFKLSQGEYIAPEKLENVYVQSSWIMQPWIHGDSAKDFILLIAVVDPVKIEKFAKDNKKENNEALLNDQQLKETVFADLKKLADENKFNALERPYNMFLTTEPFTMENNLLTPTFKMKRNIAREQFAD